MIPALAVALGTPVAKKYSSPGGGNEKVLTRGENRESLAVGDKGGIEKEDKLGEGRGSFIFAVIKRREKEHRASSKGELKEKVWNFPLKSPQAHVQREG